MARIVGLDLGSYSLKALVVETTLRGVAVKQYVEVPLASDGEKAANLRAALSTVASSGVLPVDTVAVAMPGASVATHPFSMPFSDPKKLEAALTYEVEGELPFDLTEAAYDYQVASSDEKGANVVVGVTKRDELTSLLALLKESKLDPRIVTHGGLVYQNLLATMPPPGLEGTEPSAMAIVDLGHERVCLAVGLPGGSVEVTRIFPGGGLAIDKALAREFSVSVADAHVWKEQNARVGSAAEGADAQRAAGAIVRSLQPLLRELRPSFKAYTAKTKRPVGQVLICGGTARLPGLAEELSLALGMPVAVYEAPADVQAAVGGAAPQASLAHALSLRGNATGAKAPRFNLRRGELSFKSDFDYVKERTGQLIALSIVLFVLLISSGIVRNAVLERRVKQLDAILCDTTQRVIGSCERDSDRALSMMQGHESPVAGIPKRSATVLLAEALRRVPPEMKVSFDQIVVDLDRLQLRCEADSSKTLDELMTALKTYKCFKEVATNGKLEKNKDGTKVTTRLDVQVECPDDQTPEG